MKTIRSNLIWLVLSLFLFSSGCYTILKHPEIETDSYQAEDFTSCYDCHTESFYAGYHTPLPYPDMWGEYYMVPWWYNEIYIHETGADNIPVRSVIGERVIRMRSDDALISPIKSRIGDRPPLTGRENDDRSKKILDRKSEPEKSKIERRSVRRYDRRNYEKRDIQKEESKSGEEDKNNGRRKSGRR